MNRVVTEGENLSRGILTVLSRGGYRERVSLLEGSRAARYVAVLVYRLQLVGCCRCNRSVRKY